MGSWLTAHGQGRRIKIEGEKVLKSEYRIPSPFYTIWNLNTYLLSY